MEWSGRAPAPPASEAGKGRLRQGARHVTEIEYLHRRDRHRYRSEYGATPMTQILGSNHFHIERFTFPNWDGTDQKRSVTITGDEMKYTNTAASGGGKAELVWKRAK